MVRTETSENGAEHEKQHQTSDDTVRRVRDADERLTPERAEDQRREQTFDIAVQRGILQFFICHNDVFFNRFCECEKNS